MSQEPQIVPDYQNFPTVLGTVVETYLVNYNSPMNNVLD